MNQQIAYPDQAQSAQTGASPAAQMAMPAAQAGMPPPLLGAGQAVSNNAGMDAAMGAPGVVAAMTDDPSLYGNISLPRISVAVFCLQQSTVEILIGAARDRRAGTTNFNIYEGGVQAAIQAYSAAVTPDLLIVESGQMGDQLLNELGGLANVCDLKTKVVVIGIDNDVQLYRNLISEGVSDYLVPPFSPLEFLSRLSSLFSDPDQAILGQLTSFYGVRGGTGVSSLAHHVAWWMAEQLGTTTNLVDLDLAFGTVGLDFNLEGGRGVGEALAEGGELEPQLVGSMLVEATPNLSLFTTLGDLYSPADFSGNDWSNLAKSLRQVSPQILVDLPTSWEPWTRQALIESDKIILCAMRDLVSLRNVKQVTDFLRSVRPHDSDPILILTQTGVPKRPEVPAKEFTTACGLQPLASLPFDAALFGSLPIAEN